MKAIEREEAVRLRIEEQLSFGEISRRLGVSKGTLSRWLENLPLSEERLLELRRAGWTKGEVKRERFRNAMRIRREKTEHEIYEKQRRRFVRISDQALFVAGLMLYAAEGEKKSKSDISFTNTDYILVSFFADWITQFLELPKGKMRLQLHLYENMDVLGEEKFWLTQLGFKREQLWISQVRPLRPGSFTYRDTARHGTCKLYVGSVPAKAKLMLSIRAFFDKHTGYMRA